MAVQTNIGLLKPTFLAYLFLAGLLLVGSPCSTKHNVSTTTGRALEHLAALPQSSTCNSLLLQLMPSVEGLPSVPMLPSTQLSMLSMCIAQLLVTMQIRVSPYETIFNYLVQCITIIAILCCYCNSSTFVLSASSATICYLEAQVRSGRSCMFGAASM